MAHEPGYRGTEYSYSYSYTHRAIRRVCVPGTRMFTVSCCAPAKVAVAAIGYETSTTPYWSHKLIVSVVTSLPTFVADKIIFGMHAGA